MRFTQPQINEIFESLPEKEEGLNTVLKLPLETLMKMERSEYKKAHTD